MRYSLPWGFDEPFVGDQRAVLFEEHPIFGNGHN